MQTERFEMLDDSFAEAPFTTSAFRPDLKAVLVYQDFKISLMGKEIFDMIVKKAGAEGTAQLTVWRFDFFYTATMTTAVSHQAEEADVIIVAIRDPHSLPPQVRHWLERWSQRRRQPSGALVAVFDSSHGQLAQESASSALLRLAAERAGIDYFCTAGGLQAEPNPEEHDAKTQI